MNKYRVNKAPKEYTKGAICESCHRPITSHRGICCVQQIEDDKANKIIDAPLIWFHKACLGGHGVH